MKWSTFIGEDSDHFKEGDWNVIDDMTGFKVKASETVKQWDGARTARPLKRNPQDFLRGRKERIRTPFARPEATDVFGQTSVDDL